MAAVGTVKRPYSECRQDIWDGDAALWAPTLKGVWAKVKHFIRRPLHFGIQDATGSRWIHAAKLLWCYGFGQVNEGRLLLGEFTQKGGGSTSLFRNQLKGESGNWHIFRPQFRHDWQRRESVNQFLDITGEPYNNWTIARNWVRSLPFVRWFVSRAAVDENDLSDWGYQVCAGSVARADRKAGLDAFPNCSDWLVTPKMFTQSSAYEYMFTPVF